MKVMRCSGLFFCAFALIVILSLCMGCTSGTGGENKTVPVTTTPAGLKVAALSEYNATPQTYSLNDAIEAVTSDNQIRGNGTDQNIAFCYIQGTNVDLSGKAEHWLFGMCGDNTTVIVTYDSHGISRMNVSRGMPDQQINIAALVSPDKIIETAYSGRQALLLPQMEVKGGEYILTAPRGEMPREITLNATTGVLIATHD